MDHSIFNIYYEVNVFKRMKFNNLEQKGLFSFVKEKFVSYEDTLKIAYKSNYLTIWCLWYLKGRNGGDEHA